MHESPLSSIRIVLVEPAGPLNIGSIARVLKNMGLRQLVLVNPQCDPLGPEARQMAVHAQEILETAKTVATLPEALHGCQRVIATIGREGNHDPSLRWDCEAPSLALPWLLAQPSALVFGREDRGLTTAELNDAHRLVRIPAHPDYPSLNLAQAVAVCCYELYQNQGVVLKSSRENQISTSEGLTPKGSPEAVSFEHLAAYYQHLETVLLKIGYLYPHTAASRMGKFRRLFNRAQLSSTEVALLRGILSQFEWALAGRAKLDRE
jgi:tRNA/rRNA methyltransferase